LGAGFRDLVVLERGDEVGGTGGITPIPDARAMSNRTFTHSRSRRIPNWTRKFAPQAEIQQYLLRLRTKFGVRPYLRLNNGIVGGRWDEGASCGDWTRCAAARNPEYRDLRYRTLSEPNIPDIKGCRRLPAQRSSRAGGITSTTWTASGSR